MKKKIVTIIGARPQFIKSSPLSRELEKSELYEEVIIHTGQHFDKNMSDVFFSELEIPQPKYNLKISGGMHGEMTGRMLIKIDSVLKAEEPHLVLVYGDTNTTLAGALSASKMHIPVAHVEAGLRSHNKKMPEEINRILTDHVSEILLCPTKNAVKNLQSEAITKNVFNVGDLMLDASIFAKNYIKNNQDQFDQTLFEGKEFIILTIHREEASQNLESFSKVFNYAISFADEKRYRVIFPVHPRIRALLKHVKVPDFVKIVDPVSYFDLQFLLTKASYVVTDSGGLQKEAFFHKIPCITMRDETEWNETVEAGWNRLWKVKDFKVRKNIAEYGTGRSAKQILRILDQYK